jgi:pSer/pThr/pTyr-binding forkhead associated (FHA) protein
MEAGRASQHCPECGFLNNAGANFCQKCGAHLPADEQAGDQTTITYKVADTGEVQAVDVEQVASSEGGALVVRTGGGRSGETFPIEGERITIGRSPEANVFLDDVTVSRNHALLVRRRDGLYLDDLGSLNGTYVNRRRIESHKLQNGDELQVGKYKLTYLER